MRQKPGFSNSFENEHRRKARLDIRNSKHLSANKARFLEKLVNLWFANGSRDGFIHPGVEKLAKITRLSERTIRTFLAEARQRGATVATGYLKGGRKATRYIIDWGALYEWIMPSNVSVAPGQLSEVPQPEKRRKLGLSRVKSYFSEFVNTLQNLQTVITATASNDDCFESSAFHPAFLPSVTAHSDLAKSDNQDFEPQCDRESSFPAWMMGVAA